MNEPMADVSQDCCSACGGGERLRHSPYHGSDPICTQCFLIWYDQPSWPGEPDKPPINNIDPEQVGALSRACKTAGVWPYV